jgi:hypothetical protein
LERLHRLPFCRAVEFGVVIILDVRLFASGLCENPKPNQPSTIFYGSSSPSGSPHLFCLASRGTLCVNFCYLVKNHPDEGGLGDTLPIRRWARYETSVSDGRSHPSTSTERNPKGKGRLCGRLLLALCLRLSPHHSGRHARKPVERLPWRVGRKVASGPHVVPGILLFSIPAWLASITIGRDGGECHRSDDRRDAARLKVVPAYGCVAHSARVLCGHPYLGDVGEWAGRDDERVWIISCLSVTCAGFAFRHIVDLMPHAYFSPVYPLAATPRGN